MANSQMNKITKDTVLIFIVEGDPYIGDLRKWADAQQNAHYSGFDVSSDVWTVGLSAKGDGSFVFVEHTPKLVASGKTDNDYSWADYELGEQEATVRIDLRA